MMNISKKTVFGTAAVIGTMGAGMAMNNADASADKIAGVYKADKVIKQSGKWYVVSKGLIVNGKANYSKIPVEAVTKTDANGQKSASQAFKRGDYFSFGGRDFQVRYSDKQAMSFRMNGKVVWLNKSGMIKNVVKPTPKPNKPHTKPAPKPKPNKPTPKPQATQKYVSNTKSVNVKYAGTMGYNKGGNSYPLYQCTGFVANILSARGIPLSKIHYMGDGKKWAENAVKRGIPVSMTPRVGSVVSFKSAGMYTGYGHVAYITKVHADGSFTIAEGNFANKAYNERTIKVDHLVAGIIHY